jgi:hypothetical protein
MWLFSHFAVIIPYRPGFSYPPKVGFCTKTIEIISSKSRIFMKKGEIRMVLWMGVLDGGRVFDRQDKVAYTVIYGNRYYN